MSRGKREPSQSAFSRGGTVEELEEEIDETAKLSEYKSTRPVLTFNRALEQAEFGRFNLWVLATCGGVVMIMQLLPIYLIYKAPSVECDLNFHDNSQRAFVNGLVYAGLTLGALVAGLVSDIYCRNLVLAVSLMINLFGTMLIALQSSYTLLWMGRLLASFGSSGAVVVALVILAEYNLPQHRAAAVCSVQLFWVLGTVAMPVVDPQWTTAALFSGFLTALLIWSALGLPENPRYLLSRGDNEGAYATLRIMYAYNSGNRETDYLPQGVLDNESISQLRARVDEKLVPKYMKPRYYTYPLLVIIQFFIMLSYYCLMPYFPVLPSRFDALYDVKDYLHEGSVDSCELNDDRFPQEVLLDDATLNEREEGLNYTTRATNHTSVYDCFPTNPQVYNERRLQEFVMVTFAAIPAVVWLVMSIDNQGRKFFVALAHVIAAALIYSSFFFMRTSFDLVVACGLEAMVTFSVAASQLLMIELATTRCRASALAILFFGGYLGLILGNWGICMAVQISCNILLGIMGILVSFTGMFAFIIPDTIGMPLRP